MNEGSLQLYYGPLESNGGERTIDGYAGQVFVLTEVGGYARFAEYRLGGAAGAASGRETHILTEEEAHVFRETFPPKSAQSQRREDIAQTCRSVNAIALLDDWGWGSSLHRCQACVDADGCGFSPVRDRLLRTEGKGVGGCFAAHAVATINTAEECAERGALEEEQRAPASADAWLNRASALARSGTERGLRLSHACLENAVEKSAQLATEALGTKEAALIKATKAGNKKALAALFELSAKLEAVFDDTDMRELLVSSRHPALAAIHPNMPAVPRRTMEDAREYIRRGEPVVIHDMFERGTANPVAHTWTLEYLKQHAFGASQAEAGKLPKFNVAADTNRRCCRYFEAQGKSQQLRYPYPFVPTTHLYRDTFDGFVRTVRKANRNAAAAAGNSTRPKLLHYLHEIVMNQEGKASVAGGKAPPQLEHDLGIVTLQLRPLATQQPFFGDFAFAKLWLGQKGIVMPIHYDATDNLYVMEWGRKRAIIGAPGQLDELYRYPNGHPLVGSSQVNLTAPDLPRYPHFEKAKLREVIVGPGDVLYLPAWWWHQFEQPFEDTAALNLWSRDRDSAPDPHTRDSRVRELMLSDQLEDSVARLNRADAGLVFDTLANRQRSPYYTEIDHVKQRQAKTAMLEAAHEWQRGTAELPGGHAKTKHTAASLVEEHLDRTHSNILQENFLEEWRPGVSWDLSEISKLPHELRSRCEAAPESSPFMSICA